MPLPALGRHMLNGQRIWRILQGEAWLLGMHVRRDRTQQQSNALLRDSLVHVAVEKMQRNLLVGGPPMPPCRFVEPLDQYGTDLICRRVC